MSDNRPAAYREEINGREVYVFRASALATCPKALVGLLLDYSPVEPPKVMQEAFAFGHEHEQAVIDQWIAQNPQWSILMQQEEVEFWINDEIVIRGHTDGRIWHEVDEIERGLEVKTLGKDLLAAHFRGKLFDRIPGYALQAALYMAATNLGFEYVVMDKQAYKDTGEVVVYGETITEPPVRLDQTIIKLVTVVQQAKTGELPESTCVKSDEWLCPLPYLHDDVREEVEEVEGDSELEGLCVEYDQWRTRKKEAEARTKELAASIKEKIGSNARTRSGEWVVTRVTQERSGWDGKRLEEDGLAEKYRTSYEIEYPLVKRD